MNDARPLSSSRGRALLVVAALAAGGGVAASAVAFTGGPDPDAAILEVDDAVASVPPSTIAPLVTTPRPTRSSAGAAEGFERSGDSATSAPPAASDASPAPDRSEAPGGELSPLAELLGPSGSAIPPDIEARVRPVGLRIADIFVDDPVRPVGLEDDGQLEVPDETEIGWYRYGAAPGHPGATVLAAHVTWNGEYGPFLNLGAVDLGERIEVALDDGTTRVYEVVERTMYDKSELPRERIWRNTGDETLVLITCGGDFNPDINRYRQNIVVYAVPVA